MKLRFQTPRSAVRQEPVQLNWLYLSCVMFPGTAGNPWYPLYFENQQFLGKSLASPDIAGTGAKRSQNKKVLVAKSGPDTIENELSEVPRIQMETGGQNGRVREQSTFYTKVESKYNLN